MHDHKSIPFQYSVGGCIASCQREVVAAPPELPALAMTIAVDCIELFPLPFKEVLVGVAVTALPANIDGH